MNRAPLRHSRAVQAFLTSVFMGTCAGTLSMLPVPAMAQAVRGLPDFTELVEQVGPSVVNIRTLERSSAEAGAGNADEQMLEFFKRLDRKSVV